MSDKPTSSQYPLYQADNGVTPAAVRFAASAVRLAQPQIATLGMT